VPESQVTTVETTRRPLRAVVFNLPNQLTGLRLVLSVVMFVLIVWGLYLPSLVLFVVAAWTDMLDGYFARKLNQITTFGRILDPFADKVIVCGTFILLAADRRMLDTPYGLRAWMVVVIVGRELLVTVLRSFLEQHGADFSAKTSGKWKMVLQCVAAGVALFYLYDAPSAAAIAASAWRQLIFYTLVGSIWAALGMTIYSGLIYIRAAVRLLRQDHG
jgi:CDP-diacylglycerol--glycerol-3-phosphate 3-phosphatidyltransferase